MRIFLRDCAMLVPGGRRGGSLLPLLFFLAVAMLYPFAVGPDAPLLARTGGGVIWVAALLAAILPLDRLVAPDLERGFFDQWALRGIAEEAVMAVRMLAHWLSFGPPLMLAALPAAALLGIDGAALRTVELGLLVGTPGLAAIGAALLSVGFVIAVLGFAKNPFFRLVALAVFAVPACIAGYALVHGVAKNAIDSIILLNMLCGASGLIVAIAAMINLNALGTAVFSR